METLKRDWDSKLTLRDVLVTISCLLIHPNPDSALNAEAGALIQEDYEAFARRAELMTSIHAIVPKAMQAAVKEAQERGHGSADKDDPQGDLDVGQADAPIRRRRATARQRRTTASRTSDGSPSGHVTRRRQQPCASQPFVVQTWNDDVFRVSRQQQDQPKPAEDDDSSMLDADQENDESKSPVKFTSPKVATPRRPHGVAVPLGELTMEDLPSDSDEDDEEPEYPPSPRKSPTKSPAKRKYQHIGDMQQPESSRDAAGRAPNITPPNNPDIKPLAENSPFAGSPSPRKLNVRPQTPGTGRAHLFPCLTTPQTYGGIFKTRAPASSEKKRDEAKRKADLDTKLWELCGRDIRRWNRGDFDGEPFKMKAKRW